MNRLISFCCILFLLLSAPAFTQEKKVEPAKPDPALNLQQVDKPAPLPEKMKAGFDSIKAADLKSMLTFLSSDLLDGRETATRGYDVACEYIASLFSIWGVKPAGDLPRPAMNFRRAAAAPPVAPMKPAERSYLQDVIMRETTSSKSKVVLQAGKSAASRSREFVPDVDYVYRSTMNGTLKAPVVFAGYGISEKEIGYDDYKKLDVKGKWVILLAEAPGKNNPNSPFQKDAKLKEKYFAQPMMFMRRGGGFNKTALAEKMGAIGVLMVRSPLTGDEDMLKGILDGRKVTDDQPIIPRERRRLSLYESTGARLPWEALPTINISTAMANEILAANDRKIEDLVSGIEKTQKPASFELMNTWLELSGQTETSLARSQNVLGLIEGSDPQLKSEAVVIGAHLDHLGRRGDYIFNGADDNGSGSVAVMTLARAFAQSAMKPRRSVLFALWTGEEEGLLGSRYYVEHPYFALEKTVANVNIDMLSKPADATMMTRMARMIGLDPKSDLFKKIRFDRFISVSYSAQSPKLLEAMKEANLLAGCDLYFRESTGDGASGGSDHASFGMKKVPWMMFLSSMTEDYHQPTDSIAKINPEYMEKMNRLLYVITYLLADK